MSATITPAAIEDGTIDEKKLDREDVSPTVIWALNVLEQCGLGPNAPLWKAALLVCPVYLTFVGMAPISVAFVLGWRYALPLLSNSLVVGVVDFVGMIWLARSCPESTPWLHLKTHKSGSALNGLIEQSVGMVIFSTLFHMLFLFFVDREVHRRDLSPPTFVFYLFYVIGTLLGQSLHMTVDTFTYVAFLLSSLSYPALLLLLLLFFLLPSLSLYPLLSLLL